MNLNILIFPLKLQIRTIVLILFFQKLKESFLIFSDKFLSKKNFIIEKRDNNKITSFYKINLDNSFLNNKIFLEGYFENEKYFLNYRNDLIKEFSFKNNIDCILNLKI